MAAPQARVRRRLARPERLQLPPVRRPARWEERMPHVTFGKLSDLRFSQGVWPNAVQSAPENVRVRIVRIIMEREASL
jgi:hypothetical protein